MPDLALARSTSEYDLQCGLRRQVRSLLHRAMKPRALAALPLMEVICAEMGTSDPTAALEQLVSTVFKGSDESVTRLRDAIVEADFKRVMGNAELARKSGVSRRHFQRRRAEAVAAIAQYARTMFERGRVQTPKRAAIENDGKARYFKQERAAFLQARDRGNVLEMRAVAGNLLRLAQNPVERAFALECRADSNVRLGRREDAMDQIPRLLPGARAMIWAKLCLLSRDFAGAEVSARSALPYLDDDGEKWQCTLAISRGCLADSTPSALPSQLRSRAATSWERIAADVEHARHLARESNWFDAAARARASYREAKFLSFRELAARSAAVLHATTAACGDARRARWWRALAIRSLLATQDCVLASSLFLITERDSNPDRLLGAVLYERLTLVMPQSRQDSAEQCRAVRDLLDELLHSLLAGIERSPRLESRVAAVARSDSAFMHYAEKQIVPVAEMLALALAPMTGRSWPCAFESSRAALTGVVATLRPAVPRTIPVAVPQSQSKAIEHLRNGDKRSAAIRESAEALADLRLRLVPV